MTLSIYLPSKYPLGAVLPDFEPDMEICEQCMAIAERVDHFLEKHFQRVESEKNKRSELDSYPKTANEDSGRERNDVSN